LAGDERCRAIGDDNIPSHHSAADEVWMLIAGRFARLLALSANKPGLASTLDTAKALKG
jgi:hypothetical protein